jgi:hypothetical protein
MWIHTHMQKYKQTYSMDDAYRVNETDRKYNIFRSSCLVSRVASYILVNLNVNASGIYTLKCGRSAYKLLTSICGY